MNNSSVDSYLKDGCGRCNLFQTPQCKVLLWTDTLLTLREILNESELEETMKWGSPCYTLNGKNVIMLGSFRDACVLSFLKGSILEDPDGVLELPGPNSRIARIMKFQSLDEALERRPQIVSLVQKAIEAERLGLKVVTDNTDDPLPLELEERLDVDMELKEAFEALTPGRKRSFAIYVSGAKHTDTRKTRVERCIPKILEGKGFNER